MSELDYRAHCATLLWQSPFHRSCLEAVASLGLPDSWIGAGFVRNLIWDYTHHLPPTPLNDVDVIYFNLNDKSKHAEQLIQQQLCRIYPGANWEVRNQSRMHLKHGLSPFTDTAHAISHWVEKETAVAARLIGSQIEIIAPYGLTLNYSNSITPHPAYPPDLCKKRIENKCWLKRWPALFVQDPISS